MQYTFLILRREKGEKWDTITSFESLEEMIVESSLLYDPVSPFLVGFPEKSSSRPIRRRLGKFPTTPVGRQRAAGSPDEEQES